MNPVNLRCKHINSSLICLDKTHLMVTVLANFKRVHECMGESAVCSFFRSFFGVSRDWFKRSSLGVFATTQRNRTLVQEVIATLPASVVDVEDIQYRDRPQP